MKTYIKVWGIIILVVNMMVFDVFLFGGDELITRGQEFEKVYPCNTISVVYSAIDPDVNPARVEEYDDFEPVSKEPSLRRVGGSGVLIYAIGILAIINVILAGIAFFVYLICDYMNSKLYVSAFSMVGLVLFLFGSGFVCMSYYKFIKQPGKIVGEVHYNAPIIYLYDDQEREATVKLDLNGDLTCTYPKYNEETGWIVKTSADGVLTDANGRQYEYLYWEADLNTVPDFSKGFCVRGEDSAAFLEKALSDLGLTDTEANAFIMYWLPQLEENLFNIVTFQTETYENAAKLNVDPVPDTVVRVNMVFYGSDEYVEMEEQDLTSMNPAISEREGFVLVEWGGAKLSEK